MNNTHTIDKVMSLCLVVAGLVFLYITNAQGNMQVVGIGVTLGGVLGLVNAQVLAPVLQVLERQLGLNVPLGQPSLTSSDTLPQAVPSTILSSTSTPQAANTSVVLKPGTGGSI